jgi:hypothetical protein
MKFDTYTGVKAVLVLLFGKKGVLILLWIVEEGVSCVTSTASDCNGTVRTSALVRSRSSDLFF